MDSAATELLEDAEISNCSYAVSTLQFFEKKVTSLELSKPGTNETSPSQMITLYPFFSFANVSSQFNPASFV